MLQIPPPTPPPSLPEVVIAGGGPTTEQLLIMVAGAAVIIGILVLGPVGRALADGIRHLLGGRKAADAPELAALREEMAALQHRLAELEERQDFAERLLAQARERGLLSGPGKD